MKPKYKLADEEGNDLPDVDPDSELGKLIYLLEYARIRDFQIGPTVQVGELIVQVRDLRQTRAALREDREGPDIWAQHGHTEGAQG